MVFLEIIVGILFLIFVIVSLWYTSKTFLKYRDFSAFHLSLVIALLDCWIFSIILFLFEPLLLLTSDALVLIYYLGNIALYLGMMGFSSLMTRALFSRTIRILSKFSILIYSMIITLNIVDMLLTSPVFFIITQQSREWKLSLNPVSFVFISSSIFLTIISISLTIMNSPVRSEHSFFQLIRDQDFLRIIIIGFLGGFFIAFFGLAALYMIFLKTGLILFASITIILLSALYYLSRKHPFFYLTTETQPELLLEEGYIGYLLASFTDYGPSPVVIFERFKQRMNLSDEVYANFSVSGLSSILVYDFLESTSVVPVPAHTKIVALNFTFLAPNPYLEDDRIREGAPTFIAVMFPVNMLFGIYNIDKFVPKVWEQVRGKTVSQLADQEFLNKLIQFILRQMLA